MAFKNFFMKFPLALFCCSMHEKKPSLDIGSPTDVRRVNISDALPGLTDAERRNIRNIREKASSDAIHLLGLQSQPPSQPHTSPPSPTTSSSSPATSGFSSREPSEALLNAASKDLPSALPTPPRQKHNEASPPAARMKSMWDSKKRYGSGSSGTCDELCEKPERVKTEEKDGRGLNESFMTLNLEFDWEDKSRLSNSPRTLDLSEGFEMQDTVGGCEQAGSPIARKSSPYVRVTSPFAKSLVVQKAIEATHLDDSSESEDEEDVFLATEDRALVKI